MTDPPGGPRNRTGRGAAGADGASSPSPLPSIEYREVMASNPLLARLLDLMSFDRRRGSLVFLALVAVPAIALSLATLSEQRFEMGSVTATRTLATEAGVQEREVLGMSFLGDTMVWPYFLLVPVTLLLLRRSAEKVARFFAVVRTTLGEEFVRSNPDVYARLVEEAKERLAARHWSWRTFKYAAVAAGALFCLYNFLTCTFTDNPYYPYLAEVVYAKKTAAAQSEGDGSTPLVVKYEEGELIIALQRFGSAGRAADETISPDPSYDELRVEEPVPLPKWDTDRREAPASWLLTRLWVVLGYGLTPLVLFKVVNLMVVLQVFCGRLTSHQHSLDIKPLAPDRAGGLASLSDAALSFIYVFIPIFIMVGAALIKEATPPSPHNYLLIVGFVPLLVAAFFMPLSSVHNAMRRAKEYYLSEVSRQFNQLNDRLLADIAAGQLVDGELVKVERSTESLEKLYRQIEKLPEWPLALTTLLRFLGATFMVPLVLFLLQRLLSEVLS